jgi:DNA/RNA-binding domain of Phe-tRNA-synthetase-like protein
MSALRRLVAARARQRFAKLPLADDPAIQALRRLFRAAGCDPSRYRPASEALLRRLVKGEEIPAIHPLVDLNNCLSAELATPCCTTADGSVEPPVVLRLGQAGESYPSLRGTRFDLEGRPVLADAAGPFDAPITGSQRVKVTDATRTGWLVSYLPVEVVAPEDAERGLGALLAAVPGIRARWMAASCPG